MIAWYHSPTVVVLFVAVGWHAVYQFAPSLLNRLPLSGGELTGLPAMLVLGSAALLLLLFVPFNASPFIYSQF